jgi:beta-lactamase regulating signal transducer with metallopeptidase domain
VSVFTPNAFTLDYLARVELWGFATIAGQDVLVALSWAVWSRLSPGLAAGRHRLACAHFAALAVLPLATLAVLQWTVSGMAQAGRCACAHPAEALPTPVPALALAAVWLGGALVMGLRLAADARRLAALRVRPAPAAVTQRVHALTPGVVVFEADVASPQVIGLRRPRLVLPLGLGQTLTPDELDAVLRHELAHLARRDFAWNLAQRLLLAVLWFHPAAWLLYGRVSREREIRCDALAVRAGASRTGLARALVRLAEAQAAPTLAMDLLGRSELSVRLRRLLDAPAAAPTPSRAGWALTASAICLTTLGAGRLAVLDPEIRDAYVASAFGPTILVQARDPAGPFAVRIRQGRVVAASLGPEPLPPARIRQSGARVTLVGARQPPVALTISPQGSIFWDART